MTLDGYLSRNYDDLLQAAYRIAGKDGPDLLHEVILQNWSVYQKPDLFCFGLFEHIDISQLKNLVGSARLK